MRKARNCSPRNVVVFCSEQAPINCDVLLIGCRTLMFFLPVNDKLLFNILGEVKQKTSP